MTYHDEGHGHTGHVYKCSGWTPTKRSRARVFTDADGNRASKYSNGSNVAHRLEEQPPTWIQRWEHWVCQPGTADAHMAKAGWRREPIPGKVWRSGNPAHRIVREPARAQQLLFGEEG